ncbi:MAG: hypothetical protein OXC12_17995 [Spirochaetaceae bacterium]|nr:hypothetical protein [Spirochaetaceae bacterium]
MEAVFENAQSQVSILTGRLEPKVYAQWSVVAAARDFIRFQPGSKVNILMEEDANLMLVFHPLILVLSSIRDDAVSIGTVPEEYQKNYPYHFTVMDDDSYRYEADKKSAAAIAVFGDTDMAVRLNDIFNVIWDNSKT